MPKPKRGTRSLVMPQGRSIPRTPPAKRANKRAPADAVALPPQVAKAGGELVVLSGRIRDCTACPRAGAQRAYGSGHPRAEVMLLGCHPTAEDLEAGCALVGEAEALGKAFEALGLPPSAVYGATAVRCGSSEPSSEQLEACSGHLLVEVEAVGPRVIVAFGPQAAEAVAALDGRCGIGVPDEIPRGEGVRLRSDLVLLVTEPLPQGLTDKEAKRRLWRDLREVPGLMDQ